MISIPISTTLTFSVKGSSNFEYDFGRHKFLFGASAHVCSLSLTPRFTRSWAWKMKYYTMVRLKYVLIFYFTCSKYFQVLGWTQEGDVKFEVVLHTVILHDSIHSIKSMIELLEWCWPLKAIESLDEKDWSAVCLLVLFGCSSTVSKFGLLLLFSIVAGQSWEINSLMLLLWSDAISSISTHSLI